MKDTTTVTNVCFNNAKPLSLPKYRRYYTQQNNNKTTTKHLRLT